MCTSDRLMFQQHRLLYQPSVLNNFSFEEESMTKFAHQYFVRYKIYRNFIWDD